MKLFLQKNAKFSSAGGSAPRPPCLWRLGALPPNPQPPAAAGFAPRPLLASGGWGLLPQTPQTAPPIANFWLRAWLNIIFRILYVFLKTTFQIEHFLEKNLAEWTLSRMYISRNVHLLECTFPWTYTFQILHFPEHTLSRMYIWPNGHFPENAFSRIDTCRDVHLMLTTII